MTGDAAPTLVTLYVVPDYLEVRPAPNGAAADRFSPFTNWTTELSLGQVQGRLDASPVVLDRWSTCES